MRSEPRTPICSQFQTTECAVGVLRTMLAYYGCEAPASEVRRVMAVSRDCANARDIVLAARSFGLTCSAHSLDIPALQQQQLPVVIHLRFIHFVVLEAINGDKARLNCPAVGIIEVSLASLERDFTGIVLTFRPGQVFRNPSSVPNLERRWWFLWVSVIRGNACFAVCFGTIAAAGMVLLCCAVAGHSPIWMSARVACMLGLGTALVAGSAAKFRLRSCERQLYQEIRGRLATQLKAVPFAFYVYRLPDILFALFQHARTVADQISNEVLPGVIACIALLTFLAAAFYLDAFTGFVCSILLLAWCGSVGALTRWRRPLEQNTREGAPEVDSNWRAVNEPAGIKLADGAQQWQRTRDGSVAVQQSVWYDVGAAPALLAEGPRLLTVLLVMSVLLRSHFLAPGVGSGLVLLAAAIGFAATPLTRLRAVFYKIRRAGFQIHDVLDEPVQDQHAVEQEELLDIGWPNDITLTVKDVVFGFNVKKEPIIRGASLTLTPGEQLGVTGPSGGGKSALTHIIMGLLRPLKGSVEIGGLPIGGIPVSRRAHLIARVDRIPVLFEASIRENLTLGDEVSEADLNAAIADAAFDSVVAGLADGLETLVEVEGRNLSGGQLQRLEIARALLRNPAILILDDAVDALDLQTELRIRTALRRRGCSLLLVSHRASSLAECDRVLRFESGKLVHFEAPVSHEDKWESVSELSIFTAPETPPGKEQAVGVHAVALCRAFCHIARRGDLPPAKSVENLSRAQAINYLAEANGLVARPIDFVESRWWRRDIGRVLAFRRDGVPVAILPRFVRRIMVHGATQEATPFSERAILLLEPHAYTFLPPGQPAARSIAGWLRVLIDANWGSNIQAIAAASAVAVLAVALILLAWEYAGGLRNTVIGGLLALSLGLFWNLHYLACHRAEAPQGLAAARMIKDLLVHFDTDTAVRWDPARIFRGFEGIQRLARQVSESRKRIPQLALFGAAIMAIGFVASLKTAAWAIAGWLVCFSVNVGAKCLAMRWDKSYTWSRLTARRRLSPLLWGAARLRLFGSDKWAFDQWTAADDLHVAVEDRRARVMSVAIGAQPALALLLIVWLAAHGNGSLAILIAALGSLVAVSAEDWGSFLSEVCGDRSVRRAALDLISLPREVGKLEVETCAATIAACNITCRYAGSLKALFEDLSLEIDPRQITVLAGPSGGGKSTLLRLLLGFQRPQAGTILVGGHPLAEIDAARWRRQIAGVFQGEMLQATVTIRGQLAGVSDTTVAELWDVLELVGLAEEVRRMPMALQTIVEPRGISSGQQQRLLIARALLSKPTLLIMDEATNAISDGLQAQILQRLRERGVGCLLVSHRETVIEAADTVYVIAGGVTFKGTPEELKQQSEWKSRVQTEVLT